jgi:hypothetical protein
VLLLLSSIIVENDACLPGLVSAMPIEDGVGKTFTLYEPYDLTVSPPRVGEYNVTLDHESVDAKKSCSRIPSLTEAEDANVPEANAGGGKPKVMYSDVDSEF